MKDYPIGTTFTHEGVELEVVKSSHCDDCHFRIAKYVCKEEEELYACSMLIRDDKQPVIFKKIKPKTE